jgi:chromosome segregation ATPase
VFSDEAMSTPIADGTYVVDGQDVSVSAGLIAQIETIEDAKTKLANLETENSTLKAELENLKAENAAVQASNETIVNELKTFKTEFENLKKVIPNDVKNLKDLPAAELTPAQKQSLKRKELMNLGK